MHLWICGSKCVRSIKGNVSAELLYCRLIVVSLKIELQPRSSVEGLECNRMLVSFNGYFSLITMYERTNHTELC